MKKIFIVFMTLAAIITFSSCQDMYRPALGDYKKDANPAGGPLKFYAAFDGTSTDPLMNAVDSVRANFPSANTLTFGTGISGRCVIGDSAKYVNFAKPNDFGSTASSFTIAFWEKHAATLSPAEFVFSLRSSNGHWSGGTMFLLIDNNAASPIAKFVVVDANMADTWFVWDGSSTVTGILDNAWHHLAFVYNAATSGMTYYKDGVAQSTKMWAGHGPVNLDNNKITSLRIGGASGGDGWMQSWRRYLDQFRMYGTALTAVEVKALFDYKK